jgi:hypothetical protein
MSNLIDHAGRDDEEFLEACERNHAKFHTWLRAAIVWRSDRTDDRSYADVSGLWRDATRCTRPVTGVRQPRRMARRPAADVDLLSV